MSDPTNPTPPAPDQPPAPAPDTPPAPTPPPVDPAPQPVPPKQTAQPQRKQPKRGGQPEIRIPQAAFKSRIEREAAAIVRRRLGISLEDAEEIVKNRGTPPTGQQPTGQAVADQAVADYQKQIAKLQKDLGATKGQVEELQKKHRKEVQRLKDKAIESELRAAASLAGIETTDNVDYALHLFAKSAAAGKASEPKAFFEAMKTSHPYLFKAGAPAPEPEVVPPTTAPPESPSPGEETPKPSPAGTAPSNGLKDVDKMSPAEFAAHSKATYGFTPGA